jgi:hypothetical protein
LKLEGHKTDHVLLSIIFVHAVSDSLVCIATRYGVDSPGIESRLGVRVFPCAVQTGSDASYTMDTVSLTGLKRPQRGADYLPHFIVGLRVGWSGTAAYRVCRQGSDLYIHLRRIY